MRFCKQINTLTDLEEDDLDSFLEVLRSHRFSVKGPARILAGPGVYPVAFCYGAGVV
jgi:hypothetical protein